MSDPETICRKVYQETAALYDEVRPQLGAAALGFRVLYGPPTVGAPFLFLGYQPGGGEAYAKQGLAEGHHDGWPDRSDYETAPWPLATQIRHVWGARVVGCPGLNAIFFRSPSVRAWNSIHKELRARLEAFSLKAAQRITDVLEPEQIIIIGLVTFDRLTRGEPILRGDRNRVLAKQGSLWGRKAIGVAHLSGSRLSRADRDRLRNHFATEISN